MNSMKNDHVANNKNFHQLTQMIVFIRDHFENNEKSKLFNIFNSIVTDVIFKEDVSYVHNLNSMLGHLICINNDISHCQNRCSLSNNKYIYFERIICDCNNGRKTRFIHHTMNYKLYQSKGFPLKQLGV